MNYEKELEAALRGLDENELDGLIGDIELPRDKKAGRHIAEKIMRKERITMSKGIKKKTIAIAVAAAVGLGCTAVAGAYVYDYFHQKQNVTELTLDSGLAEELESRGLLDTEQKTVDHFIFSKDTKVLCDGAVAMFMISVIPVDEEGRQMTSDMTGSFDTKLDGIGIDKDENGQNIFSSYGSGFNYNKDFFGQITHVTFTRYCESIPVKFIISDSKTEHEITDIEYTFEKNIDTVRFTSADGKRVNLSELSLACMDNVDPWEGMDEKIDKWIDAGYKGEDPSLDTALTLIMKDGTERNLTYYDFNGGGSEKEPFSGDYFKSISCFSTEIEKVDPHSVAALIINGERFEPEQ